MAFRDSDGEASRRRSILLIAAVSLALIVVAFIVVAVYDIGGLRTRAVNNASEGYADVVFRNMHENCITGANESIRTSGGDPNASDVAHKVAGYCDCFTAGARSEFKVAEIADLEKDPDRIATNPRVKAIIDRCLAQYIKS